MFLDFLLSPVGLAVAAIAILAFELLRLVAGLYSQWLDAENAMFETSEDDTPAKVLADARSARFKRHATTALLLLGGWVVFRVAVPDVAALVEEAVVGALQIILPALAEAIKQLGELVAESIA